MATTTKKPPAKKKNKTGAYKAASMTARDWKKIEDQWASDPRVGTEWLAKETGIGNMTIARRKKEFGWVKKEGVVAVDGHAYKHGKKEGIIRKVGWHTKYSEDIPEKLLEYFKKSEPYREVELQGGRIQFIPNRPPNMPRFCTEIGISPRSLSNWAYQVDENGELVYPELFHSYQIALAYQEAILIECGLVSAYQNSITQLMLKNHHHYRMLTDPPALAGSSKDNEAELDAIYEAAFEKAAQMQQAIEGRYYRITGEGAPPEDNEIVNGDYRESD
jgi:hypothetical protein